MHPVVLPDLAVPLAPLTTLRLGGPARRLVEAESADEVVDGPARSEPLLVIGGGSNLVIADAGWPGTVVRISSRGRRVERRPDGSVLLTVEAGEEWDDVVAATVADGLGGLECLSGIPGRTGATPVQNVGAYGVEIAETLVDVDLLRPARRRGRASCPAADLRPGLPHERAQGPSDAVVLAVRSRCPATVRRRSATPSWRALGGRGSAGAAQRRRARPCSGCAAARAWCSTRPTTTPGARARSSPTRCSTPRWPLRARLAARPPSRRPGGRRASVRGLADRAAPASPGASAGRAAGSRSRAGTCWRSPTVAAAARPICWRWRRRSATAWRPGSGSTLSAGAGAGRLLRCDQLA